jgi:excisionase family DNA binding protein
MVMAKHELARLITEQELADSLQVPFLHVRKLRYAGKIPFIRLGHNTIRFDPDRVMEALSKLEVK